MFSVVFVVVLLVGELWNFGMFYIAVVGEVSVETIAVLASIVVASQNWVGVPSCTVQVSVVGCKATLLCSRFEGLEVLVSGPVGWVQEAFRVSECLSGSGFPFGLNHI